MNLFTQIIRSALCHIKYNDSKLVDNRAIADGVAQELITKFLISDKPCMIARFGSVELQSVIEYLYPATIKNIVPFIDGRNPAWGYAPSSIQAMKNNAGFFSYDHKSLDRFGELMIDCMSDVDILGSWQNNELYVIKYLSNCTFVPLSDLEPYYFNNPWTPVLFGKKILVIHPFEDTIIKQHKNLKLIFGDPKLAPEYELITIKAVQSVFGDSCGFYNWFDALDSMKEKISNTEFDIALIGCGAYGFPLASFVKRMNKKAIHLGGALQYLFGIRSTAAENNDKLLKIMNNYWVRPLPCETPKNFQLIENARYW